MKRLLTTLALAGALLLPMTAEAALRVEQPSAPVTQDNYYYRWEFRCYAGFNDDVGRMRQAKVWYENGVVQWIDWYAFITPYRYC